ncbi:MAG: cold shock domain-containing protein [Bacteroidia bacterium]
MGRSQETFSKKEKEKKRLKKRKEKQEKREERAAAPSSGRLDDMIAYVDENGMITDTPPDPATKKKIRAENIEISIPKKTEEDLETVRVGKIDFFNESKGYGFIKESSTGDKYFVHINAFTEAIGESDKVSFELEKGPKGMNAINVKKA